MKVLIIFASLLLAPLATAEIKFPRGTFEYAQLSEAKEKAATSEKHIAYVYTDKNTTCGLCVSATDEFLKAMRTSAIIVHLNSKVSKDYWSALPGGVREALTKGKFIPKMVVTSADGETVLGSITYEEFRSDGQGAIRDLKKKLR